MNIVVTGASKGIGRSITEYFFNRGFNVTICARNEEDLKQFASSLQEQFASHRGSFELTANQRDKTPMDSDIPSVHYSSCDVSDPSEVSSFAKFVLKHNDTIDVLVNNAGVFFPGEILKEESGTLEKMIDTNLYSAYHLTRALAPAMVEIGRGHIFNICSIASKIAYPNGGSYSISKFAMLGFSKVLREELKEKGVKVTAILPGATWSNSWAGVDLPRERLIEAEDIAKAVYHSYAMGDSAVVEEITIRPQLGDL